ncbi:MAG TPA: hypothetical protein VF765_30460 [Polyangiaceae bacterium]
MDRWNDLVALAREVDAALSEGAAIDPDKARRLAQMVLALGEAPTRTDGGEAAVRRAPAPKK